MSEFVIHSVPGSPFNRAVLATLEEKGAPYRFAPFAPGGLRQEPHISRNPFGRMPAFEHGDFMLYETQAIVRYIDRVLPAPALTPADARAAARMDQLMNISDWYLFQGVGNVIGFERVIKPILLGAPADEARIEVAMPAAHTVFGEIVRLLGDKTYLTGEAVSLADLMIASQLDLLTATPEWPVLTASRPALTIWLARITARPSFTATTWEALSALAKAA